MARYTVHCALRWSDLDLFGHVNNARFLTLYEEARVALLFTDARDGGLTSLSDGVVIARHEIDYLRPVDFTAESGTNFAGSARPDRRIRIDMWLEEIRPSRFVIGYELLDGGEVASRARSVCVPFDLAAGRPRRLTAAERAYLVPWLDPGPTAAGRP
jgi:acyl-CoA thioester hydrolase